MKSIPSTNYAVGTLVISSLVDSLYLRIPQNKETVHISVSASKL